MSDWTIWIPPPHELLTLRHFGDVVDFALMFDWFEPKSAIVVLADADRRVFGVAVDPPERLLGAVSSITSAIAIVAIAEITPGEPPAEDDIHAFQQRRRELAAVGIALVDVVQTTADGELFRSMALAADSSPEAA
jgi:hypothetical protein